MPLRRVVGSALLAVVALAAYMPALADDSLGACRHGQHLARAVDQMPAVRTTRSLRTDASSHRRGGAKAWSPAASDSAAQAGPAISRLEVRSVHTLPGYWGSRHLII